MRRIPGPRCRGRRWGWKENAPSLPPLLNIKCGQTIKIYHFLQCKSLFSFLKKNCLRIQCNILSCISMAWKPAHVFLWTPLTSIFIPWSIWQLDRGDAPLIKTGKVGKLPGGGRGGGRVSPIPTSWCQFAKWLLANQNHSDVLRKAIPRKKQNFMRKKLRKKGEGGLTGVHISYSEMLKL